MQRVVSRWGRWWWRAPGLVVGLSLVVVSGVVAVAPVGLRAAEAGPVIEALAQPSLGVATISDAGGWLVSPPTPTDNLGPTDTRLTLAIDDSDPSQNCESGSDVVAFTAAPTLTVSPAGARITATLESSPACASVSATDRLVLFIRGGSPAGTTVRIGEVRYLVGATAAVGPITVGVSTSAGPVPLISPTGTGASNAFITTLVTAASNSPEGIVSTAGPSGITGLVAVEQRSTAGDGTFCWDVTSANASFDATAPRPGVVLDPSGTDTATVAVVDKPTYGSSAPPSSAVAQPAVSSGRLLVRLQPGAGGGSTSTIRVSGVRIIPSGVGLVRVTPNDCGDDAANPLGGPGGPVALAGQNGFGFQPGSPGASATPGTFGPAIVVAASTAVTRIGGSDRFETAQFIAEQTFPVTGAANAVIARWDRFPDALAGSYLAGSFPGGAPILLTFVDSIPDATLEALRNLRVQNVVILGGPAAVSREVEDQLRNTPSSAVAPGGGGSGTSRMLEVVRLGGVDRYETAKVVAGFAGLTYPGTIDLSGFGAIPKKTAILATGESFPDALAVAPMAFAGARDGAANSTQPTGFPLLLTRREQLVPAARDALVDLQIQQVLVLGGEVAIGKAVIDALGALGVSVIRIAGADRTFTAAAIAELARRTDGLGLGWGSTRAALTRGNAFPDALAASVRGGKLLAPTLLTADAMTLGAGTAAYLRARADMITSLDVLGGTTTIADSTVQSALNALTGTPTP